MKRRAPLSDGQRSLRDFFSPPAKKGPPSKELPTPSSSDVVVVDEQIDRTPSSPATAPSKYSEDSARDQETAGRSPSSRSGVHPTDIGCVVNRVSLTDAERAKYVHDVWRPGPDFQFPTERSYGRSRRFQHSWLDLYKWLTYSNVPESCGEFCIPCVLFCTSSEKANLGQLITSPMVNLTRAVTTLKDHSICKTHKTSSTRLAEFLAREGQADVRQQLVDHREGLVRKNMEKLRSLLKCIIFCGRQNIALRGHRNEAALEWDPTSGEEPDSNPGNFLSLVHFRAEADDTALKHSFATGADGSGTRKIT